MSHDVQAAFAVSELAQRFLSHPVDCFSVVPRDGTFSTYAGREPRTSWPISDGVIQIDRTTGDPSHTIAVEFKRSNEGVHGILTALGQAFAYLRKGFSGAVIVIPGRYDTLAAPGDYLRGVIENVTAAPAVGVFVYDEPDLTQPSPFRGRLTCARAVGLDPLARPTPAPLLAQETQWVHVREGSTTPDGYYRYLAAAVLLSSNPARVPVAVIIPELAAAALRRFPTLPPDRSLSNSPGDALADRIWRHFWFTYVLTPAVQGVYTRAGAVFSVAAAPILLRDWRGEESEWFSRRRDSIKVRLVEGLNTYAMTEAEAWDGFASNLHERAHSFREDLDSGLAHIGFLEPDGRPSETGYRFVEACERTGDPNNGVPLAILKHALLTEGDFLAFLHYVHSVSDERFSDDPTSFTRRAAGGITFLPNDYRRWLRDELADRLRVMNTARARGGVARQPFQAEFAILRKLNLVRSFRLGVGLEINWPEVHEAARFGS